MRYQTLKVFRITILIAAFISVIMLVGCAQDDIHNKPLKVGVIAGPEAELGRVAANLAKKDHNIDVKLVEFSDYISPNVALSDGSIDAHVMQHRPYLKRMSRDRGFKFSIVADTFLYPMAAYSKKWNKISELKNGSKIAIPNDPSNEGRALIVLHQHGLIKINDVNNFEATLTDIIDNPHNFKFIELDAAQLPRSLDDVDLAFINNTYVRTLGNLATKNALLIEDVKNSAYVNVVVARENNKDDPRVLAFAKSYQTDAVKDKAAELFGDGFVAVW